MNNFQRILLLCMLIPTYVFNGYKDIIDLKKIIAGHPITWNAMPNNIRFYIVRGITANPSGTEMSVPDLREQMIEVANYKEYLDPRSYATNQAFWRGLTTIFCNMRLDRLEARLSESNSAYLTSLPALQKKNAERLHKMLAGTDKTSPPGRLASPEKPSKDQPPRNFQATITKQLRVAAKNICSLLANNKLEAKQKIVMLACLTLQVPRFWDAIMHDTVDVIFSAAFAKSFDYALNAIATQTVAQLVRRMHGGTYCLKQAMNKYDDCIHTDLMHRFATTPISEQLQSDNEDRAVLLTIQLIKKVADQIRTSPPAGAPKIQPYFVDEEDPGVKDGGKFSVQVNSKNYDRSRPQDKPSRPAGKPSSALIVRKPAPVRKASRAQTARKPRKILTLEDVGQAPLERFVTP